MAQGVEDAIIVDGGRHVVSLLLQFIDGVAHGDADACLENHRGVVATIPECDGATGVETFMSRYGEDALALVGTIGRDIRKLRVPAT